MPEIGLRTAIVLASILFIVTLYLLWRSRCKCTGNTGNQEDDFDLDYWLKHVDEQKILQKNYYHQLYNPRLPETITNSRQATAMWCMKHRQLWLSNLMPRQDCLTPTSTRNESTQVKNRINSISSAIGRWRNRYFPLDKNRCCTSSRSSRKIKRKNKKLNPNEIEMKMQLLVDYARIDAIRTKKPVKSQPTCTHQTITQDASINMDSAAVNQQFPQKILNRRSYSWPRASNDYFTLNFRVARMLTTTGQRKFAKQSSNTSSVSKVSPSQSSSLASSYKQTNF